jgi:hypothetical protein
MTGQDWKNNLTGRTKQKTSLTHVLIDSKGGIPDFTHKSLEITDSFT